jgi:DNA repair protein RecO (recombination protein O)
MRQLVTEGIILSRTDYGEADRILTLLTPDHGKLRLMAKGVRRVKSKLAGGIELFSVSNITFITGRGEIGTLVSTRLVKHYGKIVGDLDRTMLGYDLIKQINKITEDHPGPEYFEFLKQIFEALDDLSISLDLVKFWFAAQLLSLTGHGPNLQTDSNDQKLDPTKAYDFNFDRTCFDESSRGRFKADHIKFLRLAFKARGAKILAQVQGSTELTQSNGILVEQLLKVYIG